jgi:hypothetical protein
VFALLMVVAAGCGGSGRPRSSALQGVPRALAQAWASQASEIAVAAKAGSDCHARELANSLQAEVGASQGKLPRRLRAPLLTGVDALAARIKCTVTPPAPQKPARPKHKGHEDHGDHGHHKHGDKGGHDR